MLGVLSSPLMWWYLTRTLPHMKDEALCPVGFLMEDIPITTGTPQQAAQIRDVVKRLIVLADAMHQWQPEVSSEACKAVGAEVVDARIVGWLSVKPAVFNSRLAKLGGRKRLPEDITAKTTTLHEAARARQIDLLKSQLQLEQRLATLVEDAFNLTQEERENCSPRQNPSATHWTCSIKKIQGHAEEDLVTA